MLLYVSKKKEILRLIFVSRGKGWSDFQSSSSRAHFLDIGDLRINDLRNRFTVEIHQQVFDRAVSAFVLNLTIKVDSMNYFSSHSLLQNSDVKVEFEKFRENNDFITSASESEKYEEKGQKANIAEGDGLNIGY